LPGGELLERLAEHEHREPAHEAGALGERDERVRADEPALRVAPANQRLHPDHATVLEFHDRLVVHHELLVDEGPLQFRPLARLLHQVGVHGRVEDRVPVAAGRLGRVHREVGVAQQFLGVGVDGPPVALDLHDRHADAGRDHPLLVAHHDGQAHRADHAFGDPGRGEFGDVVLDQDGELVAAEAGHGVARA